MRRKKRGAGRARAVVLVLASVLSTTGALGGTARAEASPPPSERAQVLAFARTGGPLVSKAAENALVGADEEVHRFLVEGRPVAAVHDDRIEVTRMIAQGGPAVRAAADTALNGTPADVRAFLETGWRQPWQNDQYRRVNQIMARGGAQVQKAGDLALKGTFDDVLAFLDTGQRIAADKDDRIRVVKIVAASAEGSAVYVAAQRALNGTADDIREFLRSGWQVAVQRDQETLTVSGLAELAADAQGRAAVQTEAASEAAAQAIAAAQKAKEAAERAAREAAGAEGDSVRAAQAAARAASAARGAADAAQTAIGAAGRANEAARIAANAAGQAAIAASLTDRAAARARDAAAGAATNKGLAHDARVAAESARDIAKAAITAAAAADAAGNAVREAGKASDAATNASGFADAAARAASDAAAAARRANANAAEAERAAARARTAAAEARRAAATTQSLAQQAAQAAFDARDAANAAAGHANAAADAADEAAAHAGEADQAAQRSAAAAAEADKEATAAQHAADEAHAVAKTARAADAERLAQQESQGVRDAADAAQAEADQKADLAWRPGFAETFDAETQRLLAVASNSGTAPATALSNGRRAAVRLLSLGGPWVQAAVGDALAGTDADIRSLVTDGLTVAVEQDDRASVGAIATTTDKPAQRAAAISAQAGTYDQVKEFLRTRYYDGKVNDDRQAVSRVMAAAGDGTAVYAAGNDALNAESNGDKTALQRFLETGQHAARIQDDRKAVNKALAAGGPEVQAAAQAALTGPTAFLRKFLDVELPRAQLRDADAATHVAQIDGFLSKADQSAALARQNASQAAESAARARQAADEASQWHAKAAASAATAAEAAKKAQESADAAQRSADQAAQSAKRAQEAAAAAEKSARSAGAASARASASAGHARAMAAAAASYAAQARRDAVDAGKDAERAAAAAQEALAAAAKFTQAQDQVENTGDVPNEGAISPFGVDKVPENLKDDAREVPNTATCTGGFGGAYCWFDVSHHITGTIRYFTYQCPPGAAQREQCTRIDIGTSPVDFTFVRRETWNSGPATAELLIRIGKGIISDFTRCATDKGASQLEACGWAAASFVPPSRVLRFGEVAVKAASLTRAEREFNATLKDGSVLLSEIDSAGKLALGVEVAVKGQGTGRFLFGTAMDHYGARVKSIEGTWLESKTIGDNLKTFNAESLNRSAEDAARMTFTGKMAGEYGFRNVKIVTLEPPGAVGKYTKVVVEFH